jgi:hypothetical protein
MIKRRKRRENSMRKNKHIKRKDKIDKQVKQKEQGIR